MDIENKYYTHLTMHAHKIHPHKAACIYKHIYNETNTKQLLETQHNSTDTPSTH